MERLTERQRECLRGVHWRLQHKEIADRLGISTSVVKEHLATARERLGGVPTSAAAARTLAEAEGLPDRPPPIGLDRPLNAGRVGPESRPGVVMGRLDEEHEHTSTPILGTPPSSGVPSAEPLEAVSASAETSTGSHLGASGFRAAYLAETVLDTMPLPTSSRRVNDLGWRGKLLWGVVLAFVGVSLVGAFKALFH